MVRVMTYTHTSTKGLKETSEGDSTFLSLIVIMAGKEIKPVIPKGTQPCLFIGRTDAEAERPILWPPDAKT